MPAFRARVTKTRPAARFVGDVVLEVALARGPAADRAGAGGVPDLGQVPEPDPGLVAGGPEPVITGLGAEGIELDDQVRPVPGGAQPPGPVPARRPLPPRGGETEPRRPVSVPGPAGPSLAPPGPPRFPSFLTARGRGPGASVPRRVALLVGDRHAPGRLGVPGRRPGQVPGQPRVDRADPAQLPGPVRQPGQRHQRDRQGAPHREPGRHHPGPGTARPRRPRPSGPASWPAVIWRRGPGVLAQQQVQVGPGAELVHRALQPGLAQLMRPRGDPLIRGQHLGRRQFPPHQGRVPGILGPPLHPRVPGRRLPPLAGLARARRPSPPGRSRPAARPGSAAAPGPAPAPPPPAPPRGSSGAVAYAMIFTLGSGSHPAPNSAIVPGSFTARSAARLIRSSAAPRCSASSTRSSSAANSSHTAGIPDTASVRAGRLGPPPDELRHRRVLPRARIRLLPGPTPRSPRPARYPRHPRTGRPPRPRSSAKNASVPPPGSASSTPPAANSAVPPAASPGARSGSSASSSGSGRLVIGRGGITPRLPVRRGHPVGGGNGAAGLGGGIRVSRSWRHDTSLVREN